MPHIRSRGRRVSRNFRAARPVASFVASILADPPARVSASAPETTDGDLVAATLSGLPDAFGTLVERYERAVYHLCLRTMRDAEEARDCTQEAFFKAFRSLRTFKPGAKFSTWIFAIAYHACCDRLAGAKRYSRAEMPDRADPARAAARPRARTACHPHARGPSHRPVGSARQQTLALAPDRCRHRRSTPCRRSIEP